MNSHWKLMARWLNTYIGSGISDGVTRRELFRLAAENRLIPDVDLWMLYHNARNDTIPYLQPTKRPI